MQYIHNANTWVHVPAGPITRKQINKAMEDVLVQLCNSRSKKITRNRETKMVARRSITIALVTRSQAVV